MEVSQKTKRTCIIFLGLLIVGILGLILEGQDAITIAAAKKAGILTSEQVNVAFQRVGGRIVKKGVEESQLVKKGDILMELDSKDTDLAIQQLETQIAEIDAKIKQNSNGVDINYKKTDTKQQQMYHEIEQQKNALNAAEASFTEKSLNNDRMKNLLASGAISESEYDVALMNYNVAKASVGQQRSALGKMVTGSSDEEKSVLLSNGSANGMNLDVIDNDRRDIDNQHNVVAQLIHQKENLIVQLEMKKVEKERLTLRAPEDGKILKVIVKEGEQIAAGSPVVLLESNRWYYDIYLSEDTIHKLSEGSEVIGTVKSLKEPVIGNIRYIMAAPGFADLKMSREKGQADLTSFQVRIYVTPMENLLPGMTIEVNENELHS
ncbi:HlyD family secretion protein [Propionispira raffinosivorans]|uniref:HlyD family secretion protein n=1 Tax=Propionispira raffinosivorans TaxID=86959 RepID=UPI000365E09E|nr:HlyD family secretion protein [Propionispira raffinosivorans]